MVHPRGGKAEMYVDVGAYGEPHTTNFNNVKTIRRLEHATKQLNGCVNSHNEYRFSFFTGIEKGEMCTHSKV